MANLEVSDLHTSYGISHTLFGVTFEIGEAEVVTLMGRNGVGKTTTMRSIMGLTPPHRGRIRWVGKDMDTDKGWYSPVEGVYKKYALFYRV